MGVVVATISFLFLLPSFMQALKMELIHRDSIHSPLYPGNLTVEQRLQRLYNYSEARMQFYDASITGEKKISVPLYATINFYFVKHTIGTPPQGDYSLIMDTGSDVIWLQCQPCRRPCWEQNPPPFDPRGSRSFVPIACNHPLCDTNHRKGWECVNNKYCKYYMLYASGQSSAGVLANETFGFASGGSRRESLNLVFGCGYDNKYLAPLMRETFSGILGLDNHGPSLMGQTGSTRFAYCLQRFTARAARPSLLRIGSDAARIVPGMKAIAFVPVKESPSRYYLPLVDVSIANRRVGFAPRTFDVHIVNGIPTGGFIMDSGTAVTQFMAGSIFDRIKAKFIAYYGLQEATTASGFDTCFPGDLKNAPSMTLHFDRNVDLVVQPSNLVMENRERGTVCMMLLANKQQSIFGAYQQHDHRFLYDLDRKQLSFVPADCSNDT